MAVKPSNGVILEELRNGVAEFELVSSPVTSISTSVSRNPITSIFITDKAHRFFARIGQRMEVSPALSKVESFRVHKVTGDGRCMFRALVKGMAINKSITLTPREERENAGFNKNVQGYFRHLDINVGAGSSVGILLGQREYHIVHLI